MNLNVCGILGTFFAGALIGIVSTRMHTPPIIPSAAPSVTEVPTSRASEDMTVDSRNSRWLPARPEVRKVFRDVIVCAIALRRAFNIKTNEYDDPDSWFKNRMLIENFRLNFLAIDDEDLESLITKSGCDRGLSARHMQKHIRRWLITNSADPASEVAAQERIARYGFGWLGEPGDQSLDTFHAYLGLASGETVADLLDGALPGAVNFELGGIPLTPVHRTR